VEEGKLRLELVPAETLGLERPLEIRRAERQSEISTDLPGRRSTPGMAASLIGVSSSHSIRA